ncbi:zinc finger protein SNAI3 isoform X1 [Cricetulus griseus]|uniref:zinc finger protein SNAI3 isoform X1 n=1 Tax=Cricetulus griseus TaxID=10029 RepID=UPI0015C3239D|nr:zinc finger protein SNAI3 isoform X1 [Cricetulus griseus]
MSALSPNIENAGEKGFIHTWPDPACRSHLCKCHGCWNTTKWENTGSVFGGHKSHVETAPAGSVRDRGPGQPSPVGQTPPTTRRAPFWLVEVVRYANEPDPSRTCGLRCRGHRGTLQPCTAAPIPLQARDPATSREETMPRSFLVKTHSSHRVPNYGQLETQREVCKPKHCGLIPHCVFSLPSALLEADGSCSACEEPVGSCHLPDEEAPSSPSDPLQPWDSTSAIACISLPLLPQHGEALGGSGPEPQETSCMGPRAGQAPSVPLKDSLNLPPLLVLPTRWPPILNPDGALDKQLRAEGTSQVPDSFECIHCHRPYHTLASLARHQQLHCHLPAGPTFTCRYCDKEYASLGALKMHIRTHTLPCICKACGKAFSRPWLLQGHIRTHTGEKPYSCPHCSRAFADRSNLRAHLQTHAGTKKYRCTVCSKAFSRMSLLARHEEAGCCPGP